MKRKSSRLERVRGMSSIDRLVYYLNERYDIYSRRKEGLDRDSWTRDPILRTYKFTNVKREWDYTTQWLLKNWYRKFPHIPHVGASAAFARFFCFVPTFEAVGFPKGRSVDSWLDSAEDTLLDLQERGEKVFTSAYVIGGVRKGHSKVSWVINTYLRPVVVLSKLVQRSHKSALLLHEELHQYNGWGDFMTQEVVLDLMYTYVLGKATDKNVYAFAGPGAKRGLNRAFDRDLHSPLSREAAQAEMLFLWHKLRKHRKLNPYLARRLTLHDVEFNLCEYDKYNRALFGEGTPKQKFNPRETGELKLL